MTLNSRWIMAVRLAFRLAPMEERRAVMQVPMFCPMMRGMAVWKRTSPVELTAWRMPMEAEELWMRAVTAAPVRMPSRGLEKAEKSWRNSGRSWRPETARSMVFMPMKRMPSPRAIWPTMRRRPPLRKR